LRLIEEIKEKQSLLDDHTKKYYWNRLLKLVLPSANLHTSLSLDEDDDRNPYIDTIVKIRFIFSIFSLSNNENSKSNNDWKILYTHKTKHYNTSNYCLNDSSEDDLRRRNDDGLKITKISFGYENGTYFINTRNKEIKVYICEFLPYTYNSDYEYEIGIFGEDVDSLMEKYVDNYNIPEWIAISCFLKIRERKISPDQVYKYFTDIEEGDAVHPL